VGRLLRGDVSAPRGGTAGPGKRRAPGFWNAKLRHADLRWASVRSSRFYDTTDITDLRLFECEIEGSSLAAAHAYLIGEDGQVLVRPEEKEGEPNQAIDVYQRLGQHFQAARDYPRAIAFYRKGADLGGKLERDAGPGLVRVFVSYGREDGDLVGGLFTQLDLARFRGHLETWRDERIEAGEDWDLTIRAHLEETDIALFVVSQRSVASTYIRDVELPLALERRKAGKLEVIPVILDEVDLTSCTTGARSRPRRRSTISPRTTERSASRR
jgi:hypothetical protein